MHNSYMINYKEIGHPLLLAINNNIHFSVSSSSSTKNNQPGTKTYKIPITWALNKAVGAASQWWSNERMMVYFKLMMVKCSLMMVNCLLMMVKCFSMMLKWVYDHTLNSPSLIGISPSLTSILPSLAWSVPSFAHLTIIEKLHRL